jgi:hypothetical protein
MPFTKSLPNVEDGGLHGDHVSATIQRLMVGRRGSIRAQAGQPAILDS